MSLRQPIRGSALHKAKVMTGAQGSIGWIISGKPDYVERFLEHHSDKALEEICEAAEKLGRLGREMLKRRSKDQHGGIEEPAP